MTGRKIIAAVVILVVVLIVAGVVAADGPQGTNQITLPYRAFYGGPGAAMNLIQNSPTRGAGDPAFYGEGVANDGVWGISSQANGILGQGVVGMVAMGSSYGLAAFNTNNGPGLYSKSSTSYGIVGINDSQTRRSTPGIFGQGIAEDGGWFFSDRANGIFGNGSTGGYMQGSYRGLFALGTNGNGAEIQGAADGMTVRGGQDGIDVRTSNGGRSAVYAINESDGAGITVRSSGTGLDVQGNGDGIIGVANGDGANGIVGVAKNGDQPYAIWGQGDGKWAGYFSGDVRVTGDLDNSLAAVKMDHPLAPTERYLNQAAVVGGDMLTLYNGNVTTDAKGEAVVKMPAYVEALSKDFRYQLTPIGQFAQAIIAKELKDGEFVIRTDKPNVKVSWQVSGLRNDAYAKSRGWSAEEDKPAADKGTYLAPQAFGQPKSMSVDAARIDTLNKKLEASKATYAAKNAASKTAPSAIPDAAKLQSLPKFTQPSIVPKAPAAKLPSLPDVEP